MGVGLLHVANVYAEAQAAALVWVCNKVNLLWLLGLWKKGAARYMNGKRRSEYGKEEFTVLSWILQMFSQVTAERIFSSFPFGLQLGSLILHQASVTYPDQSKYTLKSTIGPTAHGMGRGEMRSKSKRKAQIRKSTVSNKRNHPLTSWLSHHRAGVGEEFWSGTRPTSLHHQGLSSLMPLNRAWGETLCRVWGEKLRHNVLPLQEALQKRYFSVLSNYLSIYPSILFVPRCSGGHRVLVLSGGLKCQNFLQRGGQRSKGEGREITACFFFTSLDITEPLSPNPPPTTPLSLFLPPFFLFCSHGSNRKPALCLPERFQNTQFPVKGTLFGKQKQTKRRTLGRETARWGERERQKEIHREGAGKNWRTLQSRWERGKTQGSR